jgi:hypothetical protein
LSKFFLLPLTHPHTLTRTQSAEFVVFHPNQDSWRTFNVVRNARVTAQIFAEREAEVAAAAAAAAAAARSP